MEYFILPKHPMEEPENNKKEAERDINKKELYDQKKAEKEKRRKRENVKEKTARGGKRVGKGIIYAAIAAVVAGGIGWLISLAPNLPPTSQQNHSESSPPAHILSTPIPDAIQRHMLEHADGAGAPGIIIQYNCDDFDCERNLVGKLTTLVEEYPDNVYLAPGSYDGKIILTRLGRREILEGFDEQAIRSFIEL